MLGFARLRWRRQPSDQGEQLGEVRADRIPGIVGGPWSAAATIEPSSRARTTTPVQVATRQAAPKIGPSSRRIQRLGRNRGLRRGAHW